jgi:3-phenylpropionate/trans-cinnamate dioxygenase ferredoxin reductase component
MVETDRHSSGADDRVLIIGGGQAASQTATSLRQGGHRGEITLVGDEPVPPYQRPPLSKAYLKGEIGPERLFFRPAAAYADMGVTLKTGLSALGIDRAQRQAQLSDGTTCGYDRLVLATGARARRLKCEGSDLQGVLELRTLADTDKLAPYMKPGARIVIIGAGYIGLEAAAVARTLGLEVTVLEMASRVLARVAVPQMSDFFEHWHRAQGVTILTGAHLAGFIGEKGQISGVQLADGRTLACDLALVGIGIEPNDALARQAGLTAKDGIYTDRDGRTSDPRIFAAGDCARRPLIHYAREGRLESVHNAIEQGKLVAAAILGLPRPAEDVPWFWSDQYTLKLQIAGLSAGADQIEVRGSPEAGRFAVYALRQGRVIGVDAVNAPPEFLTAKGLISRSVMLAPDEIRDTSVPIKDIAARALASAD